MYASFGRLAVLKLVASMNASADVLALASAEVDVSAIAEGTMITLKWRGKPVFIKHRTPAEIAAAEAVNLSELRDPQADKDRIQKPNFLIVLGVFFFDFEVDIFVNSFPQGLHTFGMCAAR